MKKVQWCQQLALLLSIAESLGNRKTPVQSRMRHLVMALKHHRHAESGLKMHLLRSTPRHIIERCDGSGCPALRLAENGHGPKDASCRCRQSDADSCIAARSKTPFESRAHLDKIR